MRVAQAQTGGLLAVRTAMVLATLLVLAGAQPPSAGASRGTSLRYARPRHACATPTKQHASCFAVVKTPVAPAAAAEEDAQPYRAGAGASSSGPAGGLTPEDLESAYGFSSAGG